MNHVPSFIMILMVAMVFAVVFFWLHRIFKALYEDFIHFSRRFRGVE